MLSLSVAKIQSQLGTESSSTGRPIFNPNPHSNEIDYLRNITLNITINNNITIEQIIQNIGESTDKYLDKLYVDVEPTLETEVIIKDNINQNHILIIDVDISLYYDTLEVDDDIPIINDIDLENDIQSFMDTIYGPNQVHINNLDQFDSSHSNKSATSYYSTSIINNGEESKPEIIATGEIRHNSSFLLYLVIGLLMIIICIFCVLCLICGICIGKYTKIDKNIEHTNNTRNDVEDINSIKTLRVSVMNTDKARNGVAFNALTSNSSLILNKIEIRNNQIETISTITPGECTTVYFDEGMFNELNNKIKYPEDMTDSEELYTIHEHTDKENFIPNRDQEKIAIDIDSDDDLYESVP